MQPHCIDDELRFLGSLCLSASRESSQVDYGEGALTVHPRTGKYRKPRLFIMTLRYSRRSFRKVVWQSSAAVWARLHEEAFRYLQGVTQYVVLDSVPGHRI